MKERHSIPAMSTTTTDFLSLHPQHQYYSSPAINNTAAAGIQMNDIYGGLMSSTYHHQDPWVQRHQHSSSTLDVDVDYEVQDYNQEDVDGELLTALINNHVENKEEEIVPWQAAADDVSSWEWSRLGGTLESIVDEAPCLIPLIIQHVPDHGNEVEKEDEEKDDNQVVLLENQEYCQMVPQVLAEMENTVVQSKHSICNTEWMTVEEEADRNDHCYLTSHSSTLPLPLPLPPSPSYHSQREARKITEKRQMQRGKSSTTISSSTNKRSIATLLHNKSERRRRSKINDRLETLQKLLPNFNKTNKVSMLDQVIEYVKKLQTQNDQMMNMRLGMFDYNNMPVAVHPMMMMPHYITTMQDMQQQMSMMTQMGMDTSMNPAGLVMKPTGSIVHPNMRQE